MSSTLAAIAPPKTPRHSGESAARAGQAFELMPLLMGSLPPRFAGARARGALAIDVPRTHGSPVLPSRLEHPASRPSCGAGTTLRGA